MHDHSLCIEHAKDAFYRRLNYGWRGGRPLIELIVDRCRWEVITDREVFWLRLPPDRLLFIRHDFRREAYFTKFVVSAKYSAAWEVHTVFIKV